jgi:putative protease
MNLITRVQTLKELERASELGVNEILIETKEFSRLGKFPLTDIEAAHQIARQKQLDLVFSWDILMTDDAFVKTIEELKQVDLSSFKAIRVQDPGALEYILEKTDKPVQWIVETGNHNLMGLKSWAKFIGNRLDRLVLSIELPKERLSNYLKELECDCELLIAGKILLFYTPRNLLSPLYQDHDDAKTQGVHNDFLFANGNSEESPHKGFPLIENRHGTFMFHIKDHFLIENIAELNEMQLNYARVDLPNLELLGEVKNLIENFDASRAKQFREVYPVDVIRGFYSVNKTDVLFKKLKNHRVQRVDEKYIGKVLESIKGSHLAVQVQQGKINRGDQLKFISPEGKIKKLEVNSLKNISGNEIDTLEMGEIGLIKHHSGIIPMTVIYQDE